MKIKELMQNHRPNPDYVGWVTNDDYVFAIDTSPNAETKTADEDYEVVEMGIAGLDAQMNPVTQDKQYIRSGQTTMKTGTQRTFAVTGDRYVGDPAQDYCLSHEQKYGTGNAVVTNYLYFNILNGKGERGQCSIIVNSDGSGNAGESSAVEIEFKKIGATPSEYIYTASETEKTEQTEQPVLTELAVVSSEGTTSGSTMIAVSPAKVDGNSYKYKVASDAVVPVYDEVCTTGYMDWNGTDEITAETGKFIVVVEVDADNKAKAAGFATIAAMA